MIDVAWKDGGTQAMTMSALVMVPSGERPQPTQPVVLASTSASRRSVSDGLPV